MARSQQAMNRRTFHWGFTLVEMLMVLSVLALLAAILVPSLSRALAIVANNKAKASLYVIEGGIRMYSADFNDIPPSLAPSRSTEDKSSFYKMPGSIMLTFLLTGYAGNGAGDGTPWLNNDSNGGMLVNDGKREFGFRLTARGKVYGPYNGAEQVPMLTLSDSVSRTFFLDQFFANPTPNGKSPYLPPTQERLRGCPSLIFYYVERNNRYDQTDNPASLAGNVVFNVPTPTGVQTVSGTANLRSNVTPTQAYLDECFKHRSDFILINAGRDGVFGEKPTWDSTNYYTPGIPADDITNF